MQLIYCKKEKVSCDTFFIDIILVLKDSDFLP